MDHRLFSWAVALTVGVLSFGGLLPGTARACGAVVPPTFVPETLEFARVDGEVARDGIFYITGPEDETGAPLRLEVRVTRVEDGLTVAPAADVALEEVVASRARWKAAKLLNANTEYRVTVRNLEADGATGEPAIDTTFTTGDARLDPLTLTDDPELSLEAYDKSTEVDCEGFDSCGGGFGCELVDIRTLRARIAIPEIRGGWVPKGTYAVSAGLTDHVHEHDDAPTGTNHDVVTGAGVSVEVGQPGELLIDVPQQEYPYDACITLTVHDWTGATLEHEIPCFQVPADEAEFPVGEVDLQQPTGVSSGGAGGCRAVETTAPAAWWGLVGLAILRRRRVATLR